MTSDRFIRALRALEEQGDEEQIAGLYADEARLSNPHVTDDLVGPDGARRFWHEYRESFAEIRSEFHLVVEAEDRAALEWTSTGVLRADGQGIRYRGVTVLEWQDGRITRSSAYFDPRALEVSPTRTDQSTAAQELVGGYGSDSGFDPAVRER